MNVPKLLSILFIALGLVDCSAGQGSMDDREPEPVREGKFKPHQAEAPFDISQKTALFYQNIPYDSDERTVLDLFSPVSESPSPFVLFIHGGGFVKGSKEGSYSSDYFQGLINSLLAGNIAVAFANYRLVEKGDSVGIPKSLNDVKRSLQFLRYYASDLNLDKSRVVLMGSSAGAGSSLWMGLNDDMADPSSADSVLWESTRASGLLCTSTQASYDLFTWHSAIFSEYQSEGFDYTSVVKIMSQQRILDYFGAASVSDLENAEILEYRRNMDFLNLISADDPEIYVSNKGVPYRVPVNTSELYHHPLHAKALKDKYDSAGLPSAFYIPEMGIDTRGGESTEAFILRIIGD